MNLKQKTKIPLIKEVKLIKSIMQFTVYGKFKHALSKFDSVNIY